MASIRIATSLGLGRTHAKFPESSQECRERHRRDKSRLKPLAPMLRRIPIVRESICGDTATSDKTHLGAADPQYSQQFPLGTLLDMAALLRSYDKTYDDATDGVSAHFCYTEPYAYESACVVSAWTFPRNSVGCLAGARGETDRWPSG